MNNMSNIYTIYIIVFLLADLREIGYTKIGETIITVFYFPNV